MSFTLVKVELGLLIFLCLEGNFLLERMVIFSFGRDRVPSSFPYRRSLFSVSARTPSAPGLIVSEHWSMPHSAPQTFCKGRSGHNVLTYHYVFAPLFKVIFNF